MSKKKGILGKLFSKKEKKNSGCCNIEFEEIKDDEVVTNQKEENPKSNNDSCCG